MVHTAADDLSCLCKLNLVREMVQESFSSKLSKLNLHRVPSSICTGAQAQFAQGAQARYIPNIIQPFTWLRAAGIFQVKDLWTPLLPPPPPMFQKCMKNKFLLLWITTVR